MDAFSRLCHAGPLDDRTPLDPDRVMTPALQDITAALERQRGHPLAAHLMIHLAEAATPGSSADVSADVGYAGETRGFGAAGCLLVGGCCQQLERNGGMEAHTAIVSGGRTHKLCCVGCW